MALLALVVCGRRMRRGRISEVERMPLSLSLPLPLLHRVGDLLFVCMYPLMPL
jgi:hypothetical protein